MSLGQIGREPGRDHRNEDDSKVHNRDGIFQNTVLQRVFLIAAGPKLDAFGTQPKSSAALAPQKLKAQVML